MQNHGFAGVGIECGEFGEYARMEFASFHVVVLSPERFRGDSVGGAGDVRDPGDPGDVGSRSRLALAPARAIAQEVANRVGRNPKQPGPQRTGTIKAIALRQNPDKDVLGHIGGIGRIPEHAVREVKKRLLPLVHKPARMQNVK